MASGIYCSGEPRDQDKRENGMGVAVSSMRHEYMLFVRDTYVSDVNWYVFVYVVDGFNR